MIDFSKSIVSLAPLAGYTDLPFRSIVSEFGVDYTVSEMISSNSLVYKSEKTLNMIKKSENEKKFFIQIAGNNAKTIQQSVEIINQIDGIYGIDLNCGCPAAKVSGHGSGSSLLKDLNLLYDILSTIKKTSNKKYTTVKVRIGFDKKIPLEIAKVCEDAGADFIAVHGRTKVDAYKAPVDYDAIKIMKENINIPLIANGNIKSWDNAKEVINYTGADGVMIGRGAIGNPWIFYEIINNGEKPNLSQKKSIINKHLDLMYQHYGDSGVIIFRKHIHSYSKGLSKAKELREKINKSTTLKMTKELIQTYF
jgi:tRNA-dihydrouridine synthase B